MINDNSGLLEWKTNDRAIARFASMGEVETHQSDLKRIVKDWIKASELK